MSVSPLPGDSTVLLVGKPMEAHLGAIPQAD